MRIKGYVCGEVICEGEQSRYKVNNCEEEYEVITYGEKAIKNYLFIRVGQEVELEGNEKERRIYPKKEKIVLNHTNFMI